MRRNRPRSVLVAVCFNYPEAEDRRDGNYHIEVTTDPDSFGDCLGDTRERPAYWEIDPNDPKEWLDAIKQARETLVKLKVPKTRHYICRASNGYYTGPHDFIMQSPGKRELKKWFEEYVEKRWPNRCATCGNRLTDESYYPADFVWGDESELCCSEYCAEKRYILLCGDEDEDDEE